MKIVILNQWMKILKVIGVIKERVELKIKENKDETYKEPFLPQLGDEVVYVMNGHKDYLEIVPDPFQKTFNRNYPWTQDFTMEEVEFCIVTKVEFFLGPPLHCQITLKQLAPINPLTDSKSELFLPNLVPKREALDPLKRSFILKYYYIPGESDFIMLFKDYIHYMSQPFALNKEVIIRNINQTGVITAIASEDTTTKTVKSPWKCFEVHYKDSETQEEKIGNFSPWELLVKSNENDNYLDNYNPNGLTEEEKQRYLTGFKAVKNLDPFFPFLDEVDYDTYTTYLHEIAYPMSFTIINERIENKYYRSLSSLIWDIKLIRRNAMKFNDKKSAIYRIAEKYLPLFCKYIDGETEYMEVIQRMALEDLSDEDDEIDK
eukprot:jgi/Orpsp1_1/1178129/evm.model.c7180000064164.2